jgi:hypothetical protein
MANKKITELTEETSPQGADLLALVDDVSGTPTTKKVTVTNLMTQAPVQAADISGLATQVSLGNHAALTSSVHGISAFGATLVDDADASAARTTLGMPYISSGTDTNLPSSPATGDVYLETNTGKLRWWDGTYWNTFNYDSQYDPNYAANQLGYSGGLFSSTNYNISVQPKMHFDAAILDGTDQANNPSSGSAVSTWGDRSGQATSYDGTQATGSAQPTFNVSGDDKYVSFDGGDFLNLANSITRATTQPWTIVQVGNASSSGSNYYPAPNVGSTYGSVQMGKYSNGFWYDRAATLATGLDLSSLNMLTVTRTGGNVITAYQDGNSSIGQLTNRTGDYVHDSIGSSGGTKTTGNIYEAIFFDSVLSTTDLNTINSYFANKYSGLPTLTSW